MDFELVEAARQAPVAVRGLVGLAAVFLTLDGVRAYRVSLTLASFGAGVVGVLLGASYLASTFALDITPMGLMIAAGVGGAVVALLARLAEVLALVIVGGLCGVQLMSAGAALWDWAPPWYAGAIAALVGSIALPKAFPALLKVFTPLVGGFLAAWALGRPDDLVVIGVVWVCGVVVQSRRGVEERDEEA